MDSTSFSVTPPSLHLSTDGPMVYLAGLSEDDREDVCVMFEEFFISSLTFYYRPENDTEISDATLAWIRSTATLAEFIIVDVNNASPEEIMAIAFSENINSRVYWIADRSTKLYTLLNSYYDKKLFSSLDTLRYAIAAEMGIE